MVQKKTHKSKPKSHKVHIRPKEFDTQLGSLGLRIVQITADGNCLFRAVADQLEGNEGEHAKYRKMVVDYIEAHRAEFEPFLEDDVAFEDYCKEMRTASTWAGHMELQVISLVTQRNICIHLLLSPRWHIQNFESTRVRCIHLSYHDGLHYNSVRRVDDDGEGPAKPILLEMPAFEKKGGANGKSASQKTSNCLASKKAQTSYFEEQGFDETEWDPKDDDAENICSEFDTKTELGVSARMKSKDGVRNQTENGNTSSGTGPSQQKAARNKACPCGSKKKYKACCAAVKVNKKPEVMDLGSSTKGLSNKARKQKLRHEKDVVQVRSEIATTKEPPDMGYLCI